MVYRSFLAPQARTFPGRSYRRCRATATIQPHNKLQFVAHLPVYIKHPRDHSRGYGTINQLQLGAGFHQRLALLVAGVLDKVLNEPAGQILTPNSHSPPAAP